MLNMIMIAAFLLIGLIGMCACIGIFFLPHGNKTGNKVIDKFSEYGFIGDLRRDVNKLRSDVRETNRVQQRTATMMALFIPAMMAGVPLIAMVKFPTIWNCVSIMCILLAMAVGIGVGAIRKFTMIREQFHTLAEDGDLLTEWFWTRSEILKCEVVEKLGFQYLNLTMKTDEFCKTFLMLCCSYLSVMLFSLLIASMQYIF